MSYVQKSSRMDNTLMSNNKNSNNNSNNNNNNNSNVLIETEYWFTLMLFRHFCAPVYSVFLLFVISVLFQNAVTRRTETVRLETLKAIQPNFCLPFL